MPATDQTVRPAAPPAHRRPVVPPGTELWEHYTVALTVDRLVGGIPANPKMMQAWLEANGAPAEATADQAAMLARIDPVDAHGVVFYRDVDGTPCYESRAFKAALKEGANILKGLLDVKYFRARLAERVFVGPRLVSITTPIQQAERPISVMTMQGPRTSIKVYEFTENVPLRFSLKVLRGKLAGNDAGRITGDQLRTILDYLTEGGIGADRSQGAGTFTLEEFTAL